MRLFLECHSFGGESGDEVTLVHLPDVGSLLDQNAYVLDVFRILRAEYITTARRRRRGRSGG